MNILRPWVLLVAFRSPRKLLHRSSEPEGRVLEDVGVLVSQSKDCDGSRVSLAFEIGGSRRQRLRASSLRPAR